MMTPERMSKSSRSGLVSEGLFVINLYTSTPSEPTRTSPEPSQVTWGGDVLLMSRILGQSRDHVPSRTASSSASVTFVRKCCEVRMKPLNKSGAHRAPDFETVTPAPGACT
jgi:hypothetical protein